MLSQAIQQVLFTRPLEKEVPEIVQKYGGSLYIPSPANCFQDSAGTTPCTVDSPVGYLKDLIGTNHATQGTAGYKPILRGMVKNLFQNSSFSGGVAGSPGTAPTSVSIGGAPTGITRTLAFGTTADGKPYMDVTYSGTNTSGSTQYRGINSTPNTNPATSGQTYTISAELALISGSWPSSALIQINELNSSSVYLADSSTSIKTTVTTSALTKVSHTRTLNNASTAYVSGYPISFVINNNEAVDFTVRIVNPQLEIGSKASQYVPTPASAAASSSYGPYWLDFDGTDDRLQLGSVPFQLQDNPFMVFGNLSFLDATVNRRIFSTGNSSGTPVIQLYNTSVTGIVSANYNDDAATSIFIASSGDSSNKAIVNSSYKYGDRKVIRKNTVLGETNNAALSTSTNVLSYIGAAINAANFLKGGLYFIALGKGNISDLAITKIEKYAAKLSGAQL